MEETKTPEALREKAKKKRKVADEIDIPYGFSVRGAMVAKCLRAEADLLEKEAQELEGMVK